MKVGVFADTHLNLLRERNSFLRQTRRLFSNLDAVLHAGDIGDYEWFAEEIFPGIPIWSVAGNCDLIGHLPQAFDRRILEIDHWRIGLVHGWGPADGLVDRLARSFDQVQAVIFGHSHQPHLELRDGVIFFNPGSTTEPRQCAPTAGLLNIYPNHLIFKHITYSMAG